MKLIHLLPPTLLLLCCAAGCVSDNDVSPAYVTVTDLQLSTPGIADPTEAISEVWVFVDNVFEGAFPLPARIPVLRAGATTMRFEAGIRQNGVSASPDIYEFYTPFETTVELVPGETTELGVLGIGYRPEARFAVFEDFEVNTPRAFTQQVTGNSALEPTQEQVLSGSFSGKLTLSRADSLLEVATGNLLSGLTDERLSVWLEVDFLSDAALVWGVSGLDGLNVVRSFDAVSVPRNEWTKIYFNLTPAIISSGLTEYTLNLSAVLPDDLETGTVYLDNIKLVHF